MNNGFWKELSKYLGTMLATGVVAWFAFGYNTISRAEAVLLVNEKIAPISKRLEKVDGNTVGVKLAESEVQHLKEQLDAYQKVNDRDHREIKELLNRIQVGVTKLNGNDK